MKVVDLHPDDLLDKDARGELTDAERARLDAHLARCATCRFEREVRADFADELSHDEKGEEEELSSQRMLALMEGIAPAPAPIAKQEEEEAEPPPARISSRPTRTRRAMRAALLVAAALLVGSAATAAGGGRVWSSVAAVLHLEPAHPVETPTPTVTAPIPVAVKPAPVVAPTPAVVTSEVPPAAPSASAPAAPEETAASLFDAANRARSSGDYGRAIALHHRLESTYPRSREAHVSYATLGRMLLDRGDVTGALASFQAYDARGPGPMDEAVLVGTATALERLGRDAEARAAWSKLVASFPDTPYREHARARLDGR